MKNHEKIKELKAEYETLNQEIGSLTLQIRHWKLKLKNEIKEDETLAKEKFNECIIEDENKIERLKEIRQNIKNRLIELEKEE